MTPGRAHAGYGIVSIAPHLARSALARRVATLLDSYFTAVNHRDYRRYSLLFGRWHQLTRRKFLDGYRTTHDSRATLVGLAGNGRGLIATVTFQSRQAPAASPDHARCDDWTIRLYLRRVSGRYLIVPPPARYRARYHVVRLSDRTAAP